MKRRSLDLLLVFFFQFILRNENLVLVTVLLLILGHKFNQDNTVVKPSRKNRNFGSKIKLLNLVKVLGKDISIYGYDIR